MTKKWKFNRLQRTGLTVCDSSQWMKILVVLFLSVLPLMSVHAQQPQPPPDDEINNLFNDEPPEFDEPPIGTAVPPPPPVNNTNQQDYSTTPPVGPDDFGGFSANPSGSSPSTTSSSGSRRTFPTVQGARPTKEAGKISTTSTPDKGGAKVDAAHASVEEMTDENFPELIESFDYPNAEITDVIKAISQLTGKNFIIDPSVHGKITIVAPTQISVAEAYKAFLSALAINGFTTVPSGKFIKIKASRAAQKDGIETYSGAYYPTSDVYVTRIVHLKHTSAEEINKRLRVLPSKDGDMVPYEPTNSLIITDYGANIERIMKIIGELDRPGFEEQLSVLPVRYAKVRDLAELINKIINKDSSSGGANQPFGAGVPRFRTRTSNSGAPEELSLVQPDERTNALIVVGNQAGTDKVKDLVKKLDYKLDPAEAGGVFVYYVKYGEAEKIATTLSGITSSSGAAGGAAPSSGGAGGAGGGQYNRYGPSPLNSQAIFGGDVKITADKETNSLVITASKQDFETVQTILSKLDIPRAQVYVEAIIMEMTTTKQNSWNPTYYYLDPNSNGIGRVGFSGGSLQEIVNPQNDSKSTILGFGSGQQLEFTFPGSTSKITVPSLLSFIKLIQANLESNVLSTPQILALDNEEASIEVGDNIPIAQDSTTTAAGTSANTRFEKASIKLTIQPFIRPDSDVVRMKIDQSVKQPSDVKIASTKLAESTTIISDRALKTNIVVPNGDTAVLGGLVRDKETVDETKIPLLGDIPIIGWLFKSRSIKKDKVNLVVFLTPKIIRNIEDGHELFNTKAGERIDWIKKNFSGRDPYGKKMDTLPRTAKGEKSTNYDEPINYKSNKPKGQ